MERAFLVGSVSSPKVFVTFVGVDSGMTLSPEWDRVVGNPSMGSGGIAGGLFR